MGWVAWQSSVLVEIFEKDIVKRTLSAKYAAELAKNIAKENNHALLISRADLVLGRIWQSKSNPDAIFLRRELPSVLQVEPTNHCNLKCSMCPRSQMTRPNGFLDVNLFGEILKSWRLQPFLFKDLLYGITIDILHPRGIKLFFMGEPLLHPEIDLLVDKAKVQGCEVSVQTNGVLMKKANLRRNLLAARPTSIAFSLDGLDGQTYEAVRHGSTWDKMISGIKALHQDRKEMGLSGQVEINISSIVPEPTPEAREAALDFLSPVRDFIDNIYCIDLHRAHEPDFFDTKGHMQSYTQQTFNSSLPTSAPICTEPFDKLNILWDGTVTPCCHDIDGKLVLGHADEGIAEIWNSLSAKTLHQAILDDDFNAYPLCRTCRG